MLKLEKARVVIVGLGLMGGSLAAALKERKVCREVWGVARRPETIDEAFRRGFIDQGGLDLADAVAEANIVILATPVRTILELIPRLGALAPPGCLVMDIGSTKGAIVRAMTTLPSHVQCLGGHPMCGKEVSGLGAAEATLYQDHVFILTPLRRTSESASAVAQKLVRGVGARPLILSPERHDRLVAAVSHLPHLLASTLVMTAKELNEGDDLVWEVAASGFRDSSRIATSDVQMRLDILLTNQEAVLQALQRVQAQLQHIADLLESGDEEGLREILESAREQRLGMFCARRTSPAVV